MHGEVVKIAVAAFDVYGTKPDGKEKQKQSERFPAEIMRQVALPPFDEKENDNHRERNDESYGSLGEHAKKEPQRQEKILPGPRAGISAIELADRQDDKHGHQHIHAQRQHRDEPQHGGHRKDTIIPSTLALEANEPQHGLDGDDSGNEREQSEEEMLHPQRAAPHQHDKPQKQGRLVGVGDAVIGERKEMVLSECLIGNTQIAKLVGWRIIAQQYCRQQTQQHYEIKQGGFLHLLTPWFAAAKVCSNSEENWEKRRRFSPDCT